MQYGKSQEAIDRLTAEQCRATAPIGRSAAHMDILIDDQKLTVSSAGSYLRKRSQPRFGHCASGWRLTPGHGHKKAGEPSVASCMGKKGRLASRLGRQGNLPG
jgi:hypothetical protein